MEEETSAVTGFRPSSGSGPYGAKRPRFPPAVTTETGSNRMSAVQPSVATQRNPKVNLDPAFVQHQLTKRQPTRVTVNERNKVLLLTIINAIYPIDCQVLQKAISSMASAVRIVIFRRNGVQAMVELENEEVAARVKEQLHGCDIYEGCCTVRVDFAIPQRLNVYRNSSDSYDFTMPHDWQGNNSNNRPVLLGEQRRQQQQQQQRQRQQNQMPYGGYNQYDWSHAGSNVQRQQQHRRHDYYETAGFEGSSNSSATEASLFFGDQRVFGAGGNPCIMVYGLHTEVFSTWRLFNLLCVFGNVERIKLLRSKPGCAMVEMGSYEEAQNVVNLLHGVTCFGSEIAIGSCRQNKVVVSEPNVGTSNFFAEMSGSELNRFRNPNHRNRVVAPSTILHFFNAPPNINEYDIIDLFSQATTNDPSLNLINPLRIGFVRQRENNSGSAPRSSSGFIELRNASEAVEVLSVVNHEPMTDKQGGGKRPYTFKLAFSSCSAIPSFVESRSDYPDSRPKKRGNEDNHEQSTADEKRDHEDTNVF